MSDFVSFKDLFGSQEFQEKMRLGKEEKQTAHAGYTRDVWARAMANMDAKAFPDQFFVDRGGCRRDNSYTTHRHEGQDHSVISFAKNIRHNWAFETEWRLVYCPTCQKPIHKVGALLNKVENLTYTRNFVKAGNDVMEVRQEAKTTQEPLEPSIVFDGQVPQSLAEVLGGGE